MLTYCFESAYVARTLARCRKTEQAKIKAYCIAHGWDVYFSRHKELRGD